jgi:aminomethyltransferase
METTSESIRSPFYAAQEALGATFMEEGGWFWTNGFGDLQGEYNAVRDDLGLWDVSPLVKWEFKGPDALEAAALLHTNNIRGLKVGQVHYGAFCDRDGLMVDDGTVFKFSDQHLWVMTNAREHEDHFFEVTQGLDVSIEFIGRELPHLGLLGPHARERLAPACSVDITGLHYFHFIPEEVQVGGVPCWVSRTGFGGELGYELFCRPENAESLWSAVMAKVRPRPFGVEAIEVLRIEAGLVITDYDYEAHQRTPYDFSFDRMVYLDGGDFTGKHALQKLAAHPPRRFKTLRVEGDLLPGYGAEVLHEGLEVGVLTSPTQSPRLGMIGLAILDRKYAEDGMALEVALPNGTLTRATVDKLSIFDPEKKRPRS